MLMIVCLYLAMIIHISVNEETYQDLVKYVKLNRESFFMWYFGVKANRTKLDKMIPSSIL